VCRATGSSRGARQYYELTSWRSLCTSQLGAVEWRAFCLSFALMVNGVGIRALWCALVCTVMYGEAQVKVGLMIQSCRWNDQTW